MKYNLKKTEKIKSSVGYGYVSVWSNGTLGWCLPPYSTPYRKSPAPPAGHEYQKGKLAYLCEIKLTPIKGKRGTYIRRVVK